MVSVTTIPATRPLHHATAPAVRAVRRVAGYARVSTDSDDQANSYAAQVDYYTRYITAHDGWAFAGIYTDDGISGTSTKHRDGFNQMITDALAGNLDLIVTKSVSRFARNTVDSLTTVRKLKEAGVEIFFEKENIWTLDAKGELLITIMSSLAQEESRSISENVTWGQRKRFADGKVSMPYGSFLGYDKGPDGTPVINPEQAEIVRRIYREFLEGRSIPKIATGLDTDLIPTPRGGKKWSHTTIRSILTNEKYKGDALLQKSFTVDFLTKTKRPNTGQVPQYYVTGSHEAIIDPDTWELAQTQLAARPTGRREHTFTGTIICTHCRGVYGTKTWHSNDPYKTMIWQCNQKYRTPHPAGMPVLRDHQLQHIFQTALAQLIQQRDLIDWDLLHTTVCNTTELENKAVQERAAIDVIARMMEDAIADNATRIQDQHAYQQHFAQLEAQHREAAEALAVTETEITRRKHLHADLTNYRSALTKMEFAGEFDPATYHVLCQHIEISPDRQTTVVFKDGTRIDVRS